VAARANPQREPQGQALPFYSHAFFSQIAFCGENKKRLSSLTDAFENQFPLGLQFVTRIGMST
jgi:hypothetical protein